MCNRSSSPVPTRPAVRTPHRGQRSDRVVRTAALRGPSRPEGHVGLTRVASAVSDRVGCEIALLAVYRDKTPARHIHICVSCAPLPEGWE